MPPFFVYVLRSDMDGHRYIGMTENVANRLAEHNAGRVRSTASRRPFRVELVEEFLTRAEARQREKYLKSGAGRRFLNRTPV
jgi:putative endonuclease